MKKEDTIPTLLLERFRLGELPEKERKRLQLLIAADPALQRRLEELEQSDREIHGRYPAREMAAAIERRIAADTRKEGAAARSAPSRRLMWVMPGLAAAALLLFILVPLFQQRNEEPYTGIKGDRRLYLRLTSLQVFRLHTSQSERLASGSLARSGDLLQIVYIAGRELYGVILSIDGRGVVNLHFPGFAEKPTLLERGRRVPLPNSYKLDDAPRFERFFLVTSREKMSVAEILEKARALAADTSRAMTANLDLPGRFRQHSLLVRKEEMP